MMGSWRPELRGNALDTIGTTNAVDMPSTAWCRPRMDYASNEWLQSQTLRSLCGGLAIEEPSGDGKAERRDTVERKEWW
jgi:hypothetical protein